MKTSLPFFLFLLTLWVSSNIIIIIIPSVHSQCIKDQQLSLLQFKKTLVFDDTYILPRSILDSWNASTDCCSWSGVTCSGDGRVLDLDISNQGVSAVIDNSSSLFHLHHLQSLNLAYGGLQGTFPTEILQLLPSLQSIDLSSNGLTGTINSTHWRNLTNLSSLILSSNKLHGNIPSSLFSLPRLSRLDLSSNKFSGPFPEISNVSSYLLNGRDLVVDFSSNNLEGFIPMSISSLRDLNSFVLRLSSNNLEGQIPMAIFSLRGLEILDLSSNKFSGSFPLNSLHQLRNLHELYLSYNNLSLTHDYINFSNSSFPQLDTVSLVSMTLRTVPNFLKNQSKLRDLDLSDNQINGKTPKWIWSLSNLEYLNLSCNSLDSLGASSINLTHLHYLDLHSNQFHGQIPTINPPCSVVYLDFSRNYFTSISIRDMLFGIEFLSFLSCSSNNLSGNIPELLCTIPVLLVLDLSYNYFSGTVPQCLSARRTLQILNLRGNNLTIVEEMSHSCSLKMLDISGNQIRGQFLKSLANCNQLEVLNLGNNLIAEPFPCFLRNTSTLRVLILRSNNFFGGIGCHKTNGTWPVLQIIDLAYNNLSGEVPGTALTSWQAMRTSNDSSPEKINILGRFDYRGYYQEYTIVVNNKGLQMVLVNVLTIFTVIDFSCNKFIGSIPEGIGELKSLYALNLSHNAFTGAVPSSLSNLSGLEALDLSNNKLSGHIPPELTKLNFLAFLNLSYNQLVGSIPSGAQFLTFDAASFKGNKGLWGPPLTADNRTRFPPKPEENHSNPEIDWDIISAEIGFTCGFGIAIGSLLFCKRWRKWYYRAMCNLLLKIFPQLEQRFGRHRRHVYVRQTY